MTQTERVCEKLGMHPQLAIGFLGLLLFMIGDGVESGFLSPYLLDLHFSESKHEYFVVDKRHNSLKQGSAGLPVSVSILRGLHLAKALCGLPERVATASGTTV